MMDGSIPPSSSSSSTIPTSTSSSSSSSSIFRPRRSDDWNPYRSAIEHLYRENQLKLRDVKRIMERDYKFVASEKQYKDRLASWNVRKNIKAKEVHVMIRKQQKRAAHGKQTAFRLGGQDVDSKRISRFVRRYGTNLEANNSREDSQQRPQSPPVLQRAQQTQQILQTQQLLQAQPVRSTSPEPRTPSDMSYYTPPPDERAMTMSPSAETQSHFHDDRSELVLNPDNGHVRSLSVSALSAVSADTITGDLPRPTVDAIRDSENKSWVTLEMFQDQLLRLQRTLDTSLERFVSLEERMQQEAQADYARSVGP
ncbi:hypothetical protein BO71DRAFT_101484 [Aspergillus ellipticus CBS 707.79]|uniref:Clr5 domain-containing protein n=1 Tax=Aspergillus ellipticus CBS 707.79 TaxID=1448320 RepID=A0A319E259_9EURO|nr:hypothetical protein BO71DRAFT_101484 [Aspergillus ellipticus CBS 707.79]